MVTENWVASVLSVPTVRLPVMSSDAQGRHFGEPSAIRKLLPKRLLRTP